MILKDFRIVYEYKQHLDIRIIRNCENMKEASYKFMNEVNHDYIISVNEVSK